MIYSTRNLLLRFSVLLLPLPELQLDLHRPMAKPVDIVNSNLCSTVVHLVCLLESKGTYYMLLRTVRAPVSTSAGTRDGIRFQCSGSHPYLRTSEKDGNGRELCSCCSRRS